MSCLWATLYMFSRGIFMIYLNFMGPKFGIKKKTDISVAVCLVSLFGSNFWGLYRPLIYTGNIIHVFGHQEFKHTA